MARCVSRASPGRPPPRPPPGSQIRSGNTANPGNTAGPYLVPEVNSFLEEVAQATWSGAGLAADAAFVQTREARAVRSEHVRFRCRPVVVDQIGRAHV